MITKVIKWEQESAEAGIEGFGVPILGQIKKLDDIGSGVGLIMITVPVQSVSVSLVPNEKDVYATESEVQSVGVLKVRGEWYAVIDENLSDIFCATINIISQGFNTDEVQINADAK